MGALILPHEGMPWGCYTEDQKAARAEVLAYITKLDDWALAREALVNREVRKAVCSADMAYFNYYYLKPTIRRWAPIPDFHRDMYRDIRTSLRLVMRAPRDHAKSTAATFVTPIYRIAGDRNTRILAASKTARAMERYIGAVQRQLESNERLIEDFGAFYAKGNTWEDGEFTVIRPPSSDKEPTMAAFGIGTQIVGGRYDLALLDDVEDMENTRHESRREKTWDWLMNDVVPVVVAGGQVIVIATAQHPSDLTHKLQKMPTWKFIGWKAYDEAKGTALWPERYPVLFEPACPVKIDGSTPELSAKLCPECPVFNNPHNKVSCLTGKRYSVGPISFALQYQNDVSAVQGGVFLHNWFPTYDSDTVKRNPADGRWYVAGKPLDLIAGVDLASSDDESADEFAYVLIGVHTDDNGYKRVYILDVVHGHFSFPKQMEILFDKQRQWGPGQVLVEKNGYQRVFPQMAVYASQYVGVHIPISSVTNTKDKFLRISATSTWYEQRKVEFPSNGIAEPLRTQLIGFPKGRDDIADAMELAFRQAGLVSLMFGVIDRTPDTVSITEAVMDPEEAKQKWQKAVNRAILDMTD